MATQLWDLVPRPPKDQWLTPLKLSYRAHRTLIRKLLTRQTDFKCEIVLFLILLKILTVNRTTNTAILFFGFIYQNLGDRVLRISQIRFSRPGLSNENTMSFVRQFWIFDINIGVVDLFDAGGPKLKGEPPSLVKGFLAWQVTFFFCLPDYMAKKAFLGTP